MNVSYLAVCVHYESGFTCSTDLCETEFFDDNAREYGYLYKKNGDAVKCTPENMPPESKAICQRIANELAEKMNAGQSFDEILIIGREEGEVRPKYIWRRGKDFDEAN